QSSLVSSSKRLTMGGRFKQVFLQPPAVCHWRYTDIDGCWIYDPKGKVEEKVREEVKNSHEDREWRKKTRERKMKERADRCQTWGGCTKRDLNDIWKRGGFSVLHV